MTHSKMNATSPAALVTKPDSTNPDSTKLWAARRWGARVRTKNEERWIDLKQPYALVGSDPRCDVQIGDSKLPAIVYLVVACGDRIEVWPTCPLAFPIWGRVSKNHILLVGKFRIQFYFKEDQEADFSFAAGLDDDSADISQDNFEYQTAEPSKENADRAVGAVSPEAIPTAKLILDWGREPRSKSLNRNVSIIGEDHPSLIRLHHADLYRCDHGVVCFGDDVWLIELHPERLETGEPLIRKVNPGDPSAIVGGIHLWVEGSEPVDLSTLKRSAVPEGRIPIEGKSTATQGSFTQPNANVQGQFAPSATSSAGDTHVQSSPASHPIESSASAGRAIATVTTGPISPESRSELLRRVSTVQSTSHDEAEDITMELTDRLLETNARKSYRRRAIKIAGIAALAVLAIAVVMGILVYGVMPIMRSIYSP